MGRINGCRTTQPRRDLGAELSCKLILFELNYCLGLGLGLCLGLGLGLESWLGLGSGLGFDLRQPGT